MIPRNWDTLVRQARRADLLARIAHLLEARDLLSVVPAGPQAHLKSASVLGRVQKEEVFHEIAQLMRTLGPLGIPVVLLKGAAYLRAGLPAAAGRTFSDIDILVPKPALAAVESELMQNGWMTTHHSAYDQRYYREWMHELPPMQHIKRGTVLDVHHGILPETARSRPDSSKLVSAAIAVDGVPGLFVLAPIDMVLHSMTHLFHNEEFSHGLRDLSDLDMLLRHFGRDAWFWPALVDRARELNLQRTLYHGLRHTHAILETPVPAGTLAAIASFAPPPALQSVLDALWSRALRPQHHTASDWLSPAALFCLYVRSHWLRMPPLLLVRHLSVKAWRRRREAEPAQERVKV